MVPLWEELKNSYADIFHTNQNCQIINENTVIKAYTCFLQQNNCVEKIILIIKLYCKIFVILMHFYIMGNWGLGTEWFYKIIGDWLQCLSSTDKKKLKSQTLLAFCSFNWLLIV